MRKNCSTSQELVLICACKDFIGDSLLLGGRCMSIYASKMKLTLYKHETTLPKA